MRLLMTTVAVVMLASAMDVERVMPSPLQAADRVADIVSQARKALGGEDKVAALKGLSAEGPFRRSMGGRDMEGTLSLIIMRPDKLHRAEEMTIGGMVGGPTIERTSVLNGDTAWDDMANRGGMGGGMRMEMRAGPDGPGGPGGAGPTPEQLNEVRVRRMKVQLQRYLAAFLIEATQPWVDAGIAESPDGKADILETQEDTGRALRVFIDQATHLPLMVQYQDPKPMVMIQGGPGGRGPGGRGPGAPPMSQEEIQKRAEELRKNPPPLGTYAMHFGDYKKVDGVLLPHKIDISLDGQPNEEWTVEKYKVNPTVKAEVWEQKK